MKNMMLIIKKKHDADNKKMTMIVRIKIILMLIMRVELPGV